MKGIEVYTREQLEDKKLLAEVSKKVEYYLRYDTGLDGMERETFSKLRLKLEESIRKYGPQIEKDMRDKYTDAIVKLNFLQLGLLNEGKIIDLFKKHFLKAFRAEIDIEKKLRAKAMTFPALYDIDPFLKDVRLSLKENIETLGKETIIVANRDKPEKPYLKNWLADYDYTLGAREQGEIEISGYIFKSKNARKLNTTEKDLLKKILVFYEKLKLDMTHPNSIASLSLSLFGIKAIGTGLSRRFVPENTEEFAREGKKPKAKISKTEKTVTKRPSDLMPKKPLKAERKSTVPESKVPTRKQPEPTKKIIKEEPLKTSIPKTISKDTLNKLNSAEGLSKLTIKDFRSLGANSKSAGGFLLNKIKKISDISPAERESCKNFMRQSELYRVYLTQGRQALDTKEEISKIAAQRKAEGKAYLDVKEFEVLRNVFKSM